MENEKKTLLSGIQPSGDLHLGNYLGAIKNWRELCDQFDCYWFMADMHTITVRQEPAELRRRTLTLILPAAWTRRKIPFLSSPMFPPMPSLAGCWTATPCLASFPA